MPTEAELKLQAKYEAMRKAKVRADTPPVLLPRLCQCSNLHHSVTALLRHVFTYAVASCN